MEIAKLYASEFDDNSPNHTLAQAYLTLTVELDDTRGALVQQVAEHAALTAAADGMEKAAAEFIKRSSGTNPVIFAKAETLREKLAAYRKLKESTPS